MNMTIKAFEKKFPKAVLTSVPVMVYVDGETGNVYYPCQQCGKVMDRYVHLTDPAVIPEKLVNVLCKACKRKRQRKSIAAVFAGLFEDAILVKIDDKWREVKGLGEDLLKKLFPFAY